MRQEYKPGQYRDELFYGLTVDIVLKRDQRKDPTTQTLTRGKIEDILTKKSYHPRGIKVRLQSDDENMPDEDRVGRVQDIIGFEPNKGKS